jgi:biopolymer transport protein ExbB
MRRYGISKTRLALFVVLIGAIVFSVSSGMAQETGSAAKVADEAHAPGMFATLMSLILRNMDVVFFTIIACSVVAVTLIIKAAIQVRASVLLPEDSINTMREMISNRQFRELSGYTDKDPSFVAKAIGAALKRAPKFDAMKEAMETSLGEQTAEQFRRIEYLNIIGNLGPLLGLLGTVLGMIEAFAAIQAAGGDAKPAQLAGGISAALTHTFLGLMLAVPCLAAFGVFRTIVDRLTIRGTLIAEELLLAMKPQQKNAAVAAAEADALEE